MLEKFEGGSSLLSQPNGLHIVPFFSKILISSIRRITLEAGLLLYGAGTWKRRQAEPD